MQLCRRLDQSVYNMYKVDLLLLIAEQIREEEEQGNSSSLNRYEYYSEVQLKAGVSMEIDLFNMDNELELKVQNLQAEYIEVQNELDEKTLPDYW